MNEEYVTYDPRIPKHKPSLSKAIIIFIAIYFGIEILFDALYSEEAIILLGAKWNEGIANGEYWRFLTSTFLHGSLIHLFLNLAALHIFATEVESIYGSLRFLIIYLLTSWGAGLASYAFSPGLAIGASGAAFGIIGALIIFFYRQKDKIPGANLKFRSMYTLVIINLALGFMIPRIDNAGHLGGLLSGLLLAWFIAPEYKLEKEEGVLKVVQKPDKSRVISGIVLVITILFWLTKTTTERFHGI